MRRSSAVALASDVRKTHDRQSLLFGLAMLLAVMCELTPMGSDHALSTTITGSRDPTALQQLATFAAMRDEADEENLNWGSFSSLLPKERGYKPPTTPSSSTLSSTNSEHGESSADTHTIDSSSSLSGVSGSSRRRPHRRHRGGHKFDSTATAVDESTIDAGLSSMAASTASVHTRRFWSQLHVMEVAYSTHDNNFIQITQRFAEYERMYPIVYQCHLAEVRCPAEMDLLTSPQQGLDVSRFWTCEHCGKHHDIVREQCLRCRHASHFTKLFVGQAVKEASCAQSVIRLLYATHPHIDLHRVECHQRGTDAAAVMSATERYKGCASIYVRNDQADELIAFLNRSVFFDETSEGQLIAHYVYASQQGWLHALARARTCPSSAMEVRAHSHDAATSDETNPNSASLAPPPLPLALGPRPVHLPWAPLVVERAVSDNRPAKRGHRGNTKAGAGSRAQSSVALPQMAL